MREDVLAGLMGGISGIGIGVWLYCIRRRVLLALARYDARLVDQLRRVTEAELTTFPINCEQDASTLTFLLTRKACSESPQNHEVTKSYQDDILLLPASLMQSLLFNGGLMGFIGWGVVLFTDTAGVLNLVVSWTLSTLLTAGFFLGARQCTAYWDGLRERYVKALHLDLEPDSIDLVTIRQCLNAVLKSKPDNLGDDEHLLTHYEKSLRVSRNQTVYPGRLHSRPLLGKELQPEKTLALIAVVFAASLVYAGFILIATGWVGLIGLLFSFLFFLAVFLTGAALFNMPRLVIFYLLMIPIMLWASSLYWTSLKIQYESQFQPIRELHDIEIIVKVEYRREWTHGGYTQFTVFFMRSSYEDSDTVERLIRSHLDVDSLRTIRDFSPFLKDNAYPVSAYVRPTNENMLSKAYDDVWEVQEALEKNPKILKRTNYEFVISYGANTLD